MSPPVWLYHVPTVYTNCRGDSPLASLGTLGGDHRTVDVHAHQPMSAFLENAAGLLRRQHRVRGGGALSLEHSDPMLVDDAAAAPLGWVSLGPVRRGRRRRRALSSGKA